MLLQRARLQCLIGLACQFQCRPRRCWMMSFQNLQSSVIGSPMTIRLRLTAPIDDSSTTRVDLELV